MTHIGLLAEKSLHASLKQWYGRDGDLFEQPVAGYVVDIVRGQQLIEIQTANFANLKKKLGQLLPQHPVHLLYPVASDKWIVRQTAVGQPISRRKSPKHGQVWHLFNQLVYIPHLLTHPNLSVGVLLTQQEEIWRDDGQGSWRRGHWSLHDRLLLTVTQQLSFTHPADFLPLLPPDLPRPFTNQQLAQALHIPPQLAQRMTYTLRHCQLLSVVGKAGRSQLHALAGDNRPLAG